jgi:PAS domain S-box-containing protein
VGARNEGDRIGVLPEEYFRVLVERAADGIFISTLEGVFVEVNPGGHRLLGYEPGELLGKTIADVVPPSEQERLSRSVARVLDGEIATAEWATLRKDGSVMETEVTAQRLGNHLLAVLRDLGQRKTFERKIRESEARLRSIIETAPDVILTVDRAGTILFINRTFPPLTLDQVIGTSCFDYVAREARSRVEAALTKVFSTREIDEYEVLGPPWSDGEPEWVSVRAGPLIEGERVVAATLCATSVTKRKRAEVVEARLQEQLRQSQKLESIGRLAGGVAHDFNNLLTSILGFVELAHMRVPQESEAASFLDGAIDSAKRGAALTQQLLAFARKKIVRPEQVALNDVLREMAPMIRRLVGEHLDIVLALSPNLGVVKVDPGSMEQVIMNLVLNARDAISGPGRITLETQNVVHDAEYSRRHADVAPGAYVMLAVCDTGAGMPPEVASRVFEPFFTTKPLGEGSGLGLAMCDGIVRQAGGHILLYSELGKGTTFRVYLPRTTELPTAATRRIVPRTTVGGHETLLVVEDEEMILTVARRALSELGYKVITAPDGPQALAAVAATSEPIHLLITDVVMPKMSGRELAAQLAALRPGVRVLYSSGYTPDAIVDHGVLEEGIDFLQKPYTPTTLAARVREVLDKA